jgi:hypothetical protein
MQEKWGALTWAGKETFTWDVRRVHNKPKWKTDSHEEESTFGTLGWPQP